MWWYGLGWGRDSIKIPYLRMELRCVIAIIRHGDRTPKQKMKMEVTHPRFFSLFEKHSGYKTGKLKLKRPEQLQVKC